MTETAILTAAQAAVAAALPLAKDWTDDPADPKVNKLDAFVVSLTRDGATKASMGSDLEDVDLSLEVEIFSKYGPNDNGRDLATAKGRLVQAALVASPALKSLVHYMTGETLEVDLAQGEQRLSRATVQVSVLATI
jgi:hypothetical protein